MSRIGKKIIQVPEKTEVKLSENSLMVKGPLGELHREFSDKVKIAVEGNTITVTPNKTNPETMALWGTTAAHILNMIHGVKELFTKKLIIEGIGFKSELKGDEIILSLGFSHQIKMKVPKNLKATVEKNVVTVSGMDKESVGQFVAKIRDLKKPEPYKGKGIRYEGEVVRRKQGKKTA